MSKLFVLIMFAGLVLLDIFKPEFPKAESMWNVYMGYCLFLLVINDD